MLHYHLTASSAGLGKMAAVTVTARSISRALKATHRSRCIFTPLACSSSSSSAAASTSPAKSSKLILYSKPGCCLCDGLKEKLQAAFSLSGPDSLHHIDLQVRDITTNSEWENAYQYEIPVLAKLLADGTEERIPRLSPRLGVELIQKKIVAALRE